MLKIYLTIINAITFLFMLADKLMAKRKIWRIPEATLMGLAVIGGSIGGLAGMILCRHKTRKKKFSIGIPVILVIQIALYMLLK